MIHPPDPATQAINNESTIQNKVTIIKRKKKYDRHNYAKFKVLRQCIQMEKDGLIINSVRLSTLLQKPNSNICRILYHLSYKFPYLKEQLDPEKTDGCIKMYSITKQGRSVYTKLINRYNQGLDLNLKRKYPQPVKFEHSVPASREIAGDIGEVNRQKLNESSVPQASDQDRIKIQNCKHASGGSKTS